MARSIIKIRQSERDKLFVASNTDRGKVLFTACDENLTPMTLRNIWEHNKKANNSSRSMMNCIHFRWD